MRSTHLLEEGVGIAQVAAGAAHGSADRSRAVLRPRIVRLAARRSRRQTARGRSALLIRRRLPVAAARACPLLGRLLRVAAQGVSKPPAASPRTRSWAVATAAGTTGAAGTGCARQLDTTEAAALVALLVAALPARARSRLPQSGETVARHRVCAAMRSGVAERKLADFDVIDDAVQRQRGDGCKRSVTAERLLYARRLRAARCVTRLSLRRRKL